jgi:hypothetical protein
VPWSRKIQFRCINLDGKAIKVVASDLHIIASWEDTDSRIKWSKIVRFAKSADHAFLWINEVQAIVLPYDAFENSAKKNSFVEARIKMSSYVFDPGF